MTNRCVNLTPSTMKHRVTLDLLRLVQIQEFQLQVIVENRLRMKTKKQEDIKNEDPSEVRFSCWSCSKEVCSGTDVEVIENIHRVNVTPAFRWELLHSEPTSVDTVLLFCLSMQICSKCSFFSPPVFLKQ